MCQVDWTLLLDFFRTVWSWVTILAIALYAFRNPVSRLLDRIAESEKASIAGMSFEMPSAQLVKAWRGAFTTISRTTLTGTEAIDGKRYVECDFTEVTIVFAGSAPAQFQGCTFRKTVKWEFTEGAAMGIAFLKALYAGGAADMVERTIADIRGQSVPADS